MIDINLIRTEREKVKERETGHGQEDECTVGEP